MKIFFNKFILASKPVPSPSSPTAPEVKFYIFLGIFLSFFWIFNIHEKKIFFNIITAEGGRFSPPVPPMDFFLI